VSVDAIRIETGPKPEAAVIWLHGLGADGHDFEPVVPELRLKRAVRFVFPHAPIRPVTINQGMRMRAWYDILQLGGGPEDEAGLRASQKITEELIRAQGLPASKVVLAGFSQGGAIVLQTALRYPGWRAWSRSPRTCRWRPRWPPNAARRTAICRSSWRMGSTTT